MLLNMESVKMYLQFFLKMINLLVGNFILQELGKHLGEYKGFIKLDDYLDLMLFLPCVIPLTLYLFF